MLLARLGFLLEEIILARSLVKERLGRAPPQRIAHQLRRLLNCELSNVL
jgi:hypothetical protein